jgi:hypothetical protein
VARPPDANKVVTGLWSLSRYGRRVSAKQARSAVAADHRSIIPGIPGLPWWAAVVVAVTGCAVGFAFDAGSGKELTIVFSVLYVAGCVAAVLAVRQSGIFTAVIQPPLILFCAVPGSYWLLHGAKFTGLKDLAINCGYPLIERFPLMLLTSAGVLVIGLVRWYLGIAVRSQAKAATDATETSAAGAASSTGRPGLVARMMSLVNRERTHDGTADNAVKPRPRREHAVERSARATPAERRGTARRPAAGRERRPRPPLDARASLEDGPDLARDRAQRRRPTRTSHPVVTGCRVIQTCVVGHPGKCGATRTLVELARPAVAAASTRMSPWSRSNPRRPADPGRTGPLAFPGRTIRFRESGIGPRTEPKITTSPAPRLVGHARPQPTPGSDAPTCGATTCGAT